MAYRGQPPSFKTDVHRAPTKKWADAKSYSYEGDDWGGYDEYGEYGDYDDAPPMPKPTGLRQRGQALPTVDTSGSAPSASTATTGRPRADSYEPGDESRSFSAGAMPPSEPAQPAMIDPGPAHSGVTYAQGYIQNPSQGMRSQSQDRAGPVMPAYPVAPSPHSAGPQGSPRISSFDRRSGPGTYQSTASSRSSSNDPYGQRGYSNPPAPRPAYNDAPPVTAAVVVPADADAHFPPRKSSITSGRPTDLPAPVLLPSREDSLPPPRQDSLPRSQASEPVSAPPSDTAESSVPKPFPFIRPADIYKRIQEEKEKERRSMDSNRSSVESMSQSGREGRSFIGTSQARESSGSPAGMRPSLQPVPERKSEYGLEGLSAQNPELAKDVEAQASTAESQPETAPTQTSFGGPQASTNNAQAPSFESRDINTDPQIPSDGALDTPADDQSLPRDSQDTATSTESEPPVPPSLPQLNRFSGFGSDFWGAPVSTNEPQSQDLSQSSTGTEATKSVQVAETADSSGDPALQHQPSLGFRSTVQHAFEAQTPLSTQGSQRSTTGSELSGSNSTAGISPIMSRVPSAATAMRNAQDRGEPVSSPPVITEEPYDTGSSDLRPVSADTVRGAASSTTQARALAIETEPALPQGNAAAIEDPSPSSNYTETPKNDTPIGYSPLNQSHVPIDQSNREVGGSEEQNSTGEADKGVVTDTSPIDRAAGTTTPSKGRVKDLASRYDGIHYSRQNSFDSTTSNKSRPMSPANVPAQSRGIEKDNTSEGNLDGSFDGQNENSKSTLRPEPRPQPPGAWVSYSESATSETQNEVAGDEDTSSVTQTPVEMRQQSSESFPATDQSQERSAGVLPLLSNPADPSITTVNEAQDDLQPLPLSSQKVTTPTSSDNRGVVSIADEQADLLTPLKRGTPTPIDTSMAQETYSGSANEAQMSLESSPGDAESDRIRKDIVRSLNVSNEEQERTTSDPTTPMSAGGMGLASPNEDPTRESTALPREYDSYWASTSNFTRSPGTGASRTSIPTPIMETPVSPQIQESAGVESGSVTANNQPSSSSPAPKMLKKRFSWEDDDEDEDEDFAPAEKPYDGLGITQSRDIAQDSAVNETSPSTTVRPFSSNSSAQPDVITSTSREASPTVAEPSSAYSIPEITFGDADEQATSARGLTLLDPVNEEAQRPLRDSVESSVADDNALSQTSAESKDFPVDESSRAVAPNPRLSQPKLTPFKEITAIKQSTERIHAYNQTRDGFATMHTGLNDWLTRMVATYPEHAQASASMTRPVVNTTGLAGSVRTKISPSAGKGMSPSASQPYYQQYLDSAGPLPTVTTQSGASSSPGQIDPGNKSRSSSGQMQVKGKDLLHSAGVLGGKASTGAKGLFAKGKSKFRTASASEKGSLSSAKPSSAMPLAPHTTSPDYAQSGTNTGQNAPIGSSNSRFSSLFGALRASEASSSPSSSNQPKSAPLPPPGTIHEPPQPSTGRATRDGSVGASTEARELYESPHDSSGRYVDSNARESGNSKPEVRDLSTVTSRAAPLPSLQDTVIRSVEPLPQEQHEDMTAFKHPAPAGIDTNKDLPPEPRDLEQVHQASTQADQTDAAAQPNIEQTAAPTSQVRTANTRDLRPWEDVTYSEQRGDAVSGYFEPSHNRLSSEQAKGSQRVSTDSADPSRDSKSNTARLGDLAKVSPAISRDSKEIAIEPTEVHPALREDSESEKSPIDQEKSAAFTGLRPAVDLDKLPPSVRKQYIQNRNLGEQPLDDGQADTTGKLLDTDSEAQNDKNDAVGFRGDAVEDRTSRAGPPPEPESPTAKRRSMSPWRRFRARSRGASVDESPMMSSIPTAAKSPELDDDATPTQDRGVSISGNPSTPNVEKNVSQESRTLGTSSTQLDSESSPSKPTRSSWNVFKRGNRVDDQNARDAKEAPPLSSSTFTEFEAPKGQSLPIYESNKHVMHPELVPASETTLQTHLQSGGIGTSGIVDARTASSSLYSSPQHASGTATPVEPQSRQPNKLNRRSNIVHGTPAAVARVRDSDGKKRRSWFGGLLGTPKEAESEQQKSSKKLSKSVPKRLQTPDRVMLSRALDHSIHQSPPRTQEHFSGNNETQSALTPRDFEHSNDETLSGADPASNAQADPLDPTRLGPADRTSHIQYLQTQGVFPPRAPTPRRSNPPANNDSADQVVPQKPTWARGPDSQATASSGYPREGQYPTSYQQPDQANKLRRRVQSYQPYTQVQQPPEPTIPHVPFLGPSNTGSNPPMGMENTQYATAQPLDWQPPDSSPIMAQSWAHSHYDSPGNIPPHLTLRPHAFNTRESTPRASGEYRDTFVDALEEQRLTPQAQHRQTWR